MKKIFILLILLSGVSLAQYTPAKKDIKFPAYYTHQVNGDSLAQMMYIINSLSGTMAITLTQAQIDSLQKAVQEGTWNINNVSGTISLPTGASTSAKQDVANGHLTDIRGSDSTSTANLLLLLGYLHPTDKYGSAASTVTTETDTILFSTLTVRGRWEVFSINDTTEISLNGSFTESRIVYPYSTRGYDFDVTASPKGYIRRYGGAGTASYESAHEGY